MAQTLERYLAFISDKFYDLESGYDSWEIEKLVKTATTDFEQSNHVFILILSEREKELIENMRAMASIEPLPEIEIK